jgi:hypothetical protein
MCIREQVYIAYVNAVYASKFKLWLVKLFGNTQIIRQDSRIFIVGTLNNKPYLLADRDKL